MSFSDRLPKLAPIETVHHTLKPLDPIRILSHAALRRTFKRLAHQFMEPYDSTDDVVLIGMQSRGVHIARAVNAYIAEYYGAPLPFGLLDVTFYRDDFRTRMKMPEVHITDIPFDIYGKHVILVDDVLYTGRTIRSAMDALMHFGRPASILCCCLIDRGHRELPVTADYVGKMIPTHSNEEIQGRMEPGDPDTGVYLVSGGSTE